MKAYTRFPLTIFRIQPKLPVSLRDYTKQKLLGRSSFDLKVHPDGLVKPLPPDTTIFTTPNGMSLRPAGENMLQILAAFKGEPRIYRMTVGTAVPDGFVLYHEHNDHYSLQTAGDVELGDLNRKLTAFLESLPSQTKSQFLEELEDEDDFDN